MKKHTLLILFSCLCLVACGGNKTVKPTPPAANKPATTSTSPATASNDKSGAYYLDDGPGDNPPPDIDSIPNAVPKKEPLLDRANRPYRALGATYQPMTSYQPYKLSGVASWYGKRYHGKKTSSGDVYDMYGMSAAHPTLPLPSYVKVTNPANGRFVVVRVNDRGPFKHERIIDLSYAAAYKLRFSAQGSTLVQVEAIDSNDVSSYPQPAAAPEPIPATTKVETPTAAPTNTSTLAATAKSISSPIQNNNSTVVITEYFVQAGAFKNEAYADALIKKIQGLENAGINKVYNNGLHRLKLGPYQNKLEADKTAANIRKQLNVPAMIVNQ